MPTSIRVLMVEDRESDAELVRHELDRAGFNPAWERVETEPEYLAALETMPDLILADWSLPQFNGWRAMKILRERGVDIPFIIVSGSIGEDVAVQAMREGATDYLLKDRLGRLGEAVHRAMREKLLREENKRSLNALRDSEAKYRSLVEQSTDGIAVVDEQGKITNWNQRQEQITGMELKDVLGRPLWEIQYQMMPEETKIPAMLKRVKDGLMSLLGSGKSLRLGQEMETIIQLANGTRRTIQMTIYQFKTEKGFMAGSITHDVTENKKAEEALRESEDKFKYVFDHSVAGKSFTMPTGELNANQALADMLGYPLDELNHHMWEDFTHPQDLELTKEANRSMLSGEKESVRFTKKFIHRDGSNVWVDVASALRRDKDGNPLYFMSTFLDITDRKQAEEEIRKLNADLEQRVEERTHELRLAQEKLVRQEKLAMLGQLAGGVGHELRNPLGIISSAIYYLQLVQPKAGGKIKHYHRLIEGEVHNAEKIITELMDFARLESMERGPVSVCDLVGRTLARFTVPEYIKMKLDLPEDLPKVFVDSRQMEQVLGNITLNACQAMGSQNSKTIVGKNTLLTISARLKKGMVAIAVKDTGSGITPENMSKIFEPLFTTKAKGIGLGLAVSRKLAEANGGRIEVKSVLGKGSTFTLFLPEGG